MNCFDEIYFNQDMEDYSEFLEAYDEDYEREQEARADFLRYSEPYDDEDDWF